MFHCYGPVIYGLLFLIIYSAFSAFVEFPCIMISVNGCIDNTTKYVTCQLFDYSKINELPDFAGQMGNAYYAKLSIAVKTIFIKLV